MNTVTQKRKIAELRKQISLLKRNNKRLERYANDRQTRMVQYAKELHIAITEKAQLKFQLLEVVKTSRQFLEQFNNLKIWGSGTNNIIAFRSGKK